MKKLFLIFVTSLFMAAGMAHASETPDVLVKRVATEVLDIIKKDKDIQAGNNKKLIELVEQKVLTHFNFSRMTALAVGKHWRSATPEQQKALTNEFRTTLVRTYSNSLSAYKNQTIDYKPLKLSPADTDVVVKTLVIQPGAEAIPIDYSMEKAADGWKVYEVSVGGISLVANYRNSFNSEIQKDGIDGLIRRLAEKNKNPGKKS